MKLRFKIVENPLITYLEELEKRLGTNIDDYLKTEAEIFAETTDDYVPEWNPNLSLSPFEKEHQVLYGDEWVKGIEIWYTGWTKQAMSGPLPVGVFPQHGDVDTRMLKEDYAEDVEMRYQFIEKGIDDYLMSYEDDLSKFVNKLLNG